ncbi:hypothetical protein TEA_015959 [Camellia sinensis var. sinensis]|uniref:Uncharacterized protein n=2 Tax=Camellia sinensis TaxID=4442 RepID=A0A4S4F362_CAMSN|nr:hypothetical protein TEA_015959 [Camellia sinensis var. sinensis]
MNLTKLKQKKSKAAFRRCILKKSKKLGIEFYLAAFGFLGLSLKSTIHGSQLQSIPNGHIALNAIQRRHAKVSTGDTISMSRFVPPKDFNLALLTLELEFVKKWAKDEQEARCFSVVLECVLAPVVASTTSTLRIPTIGHCQSIVSKSVFTQFRAHKSLISSLCFDPSGMLLVTASVHGHNINVFRIMPGPLGSSSGPDSGASYVHLCRLQRGFTNAVVKTPVAFCLLPAAATYSPFGARGTLCGTNQVMDCEILKEITEAKGKTVAQVCLRWVYEQGVSVLVKSFNKERMEENLDIFDWTLSPEESKKINQIPQQKGCPGLEFTSDQGPYKYVEELWDEKI